jgi:hypothetical protein
LISKFYRCALVVLCVATMAGCGAGTGMNNLPSTAQQVSENAPVSPITKPADCPLSDSRSKIHTADCGCDTVLCDSGNNGTDGGGGILTDTWIVGVCAVAFNGDGSAVSNCEPGYWEAGSDSEPSGCTVCYSGSGTTGDGGTPVAVYPETPKIGVSCPSNDGSESLPVGATVGYASINGQTVARSVANINVIYGYSSENTASASVEYVNLQTLGWVYEDNGGAFWFQQNANISWTYSFGVGISTGSLISASFGINSPPGQAAVSIGSKLKPLAAYTSASPCFSGEGNSFFAGEIS